MYCENCGKTNDDDAIICPYCGTIHTRQKNNYNAEKPINFWGIIGFAVSLLSLWLGAYYCIVCIAGIVLNYIALLKRKKYSQNGIATAGMAISIAALIIWLILLTAVFSLTGSVSVPPVIKIIF